MTFTLRSWRVALTALAVFTFTAAATRGDELSSLWLVDPLAIATVPDSEETAWSVPSFSGVLDEASASMLGQRRRGRGSRGGGVWANVYFGKTAVKRDIEVGQLKIAPDILGAQIGFDKRLFGIRWSLYYNYGNTFTRTTIASNELARWKTDNHLLGLSLVKYNALSHFLILGNVGYDMHQVPAMLSVPIGGKAHGVQTSLYGEVGLDIVLPNKSWAIKPFTGLHYSYLFSGDIENTVASDIHLRNNSNHALQWITGVRCNKRFNALLEAQARVAFLEHLLEERAAIDTHPFSMVNGTMTPTQFLVFGDSGRDFAWLGAGLKWYVNYTDIRIFMDYDAIFNSRAATHLGSLGVLLAW